MTPISLDGRVAIVTGAGRGLGEAYSRLLANRGAAVVVNDLGTDGEGNGEDESLAEGVARSIREAGGKAVADHNDVSSVAGGRAIVDRAVKSFGRIDIVVPNAGICGSQPFDEATLEDFERYWRVHLAGHVNVISPAWKLMSEQRYGRVVTVESAAGLYGQEGQATYAAAKGAVHGLMRVLAIEGNDRGILVNSVQPGGFTRMVTAAIDDPDTVEQMRVAMPTSLVSPLVTWLASEDCTMSGQVFSAWMGRVARHAIGAGPGYVNPELTPELIVEHLNEIMSTEELYEPASAVDDVMNFAST